MAKEGEDFYKISSKNVNGKVVDLTIFRPVGSDAHGTVVKVEPKPQAGSKSSGSSTSSS